MPRLQDKISRTACMSGEEQHQHTLHYFTQQVPVVTVAPGPRKVSFYLYVKQYFHFCFPHSFRVSWDERFYGSLYLLSHMQTTGCYKGLLVFCQWS